MACPSLKNRTFTTLADKNDSVLADDYVHGAFETWKLKGKTANGGKFDYKAKTKFSQKGSQVNFNLNDEVKIQFPYSRYYWQLEAKRSGDLALHADLGNVTVGGQDVNLFTNLSTKVDFKNFNVNFGYNWFKNDLTVSSQLESKTNDSKHTDLALTNRTFFRNGNLFYALVTKFGLLEGIALRQYDAMFGYEKDSTNVYLEHESNAKSAQFGLGKLTGTVTYAKDGNNFGVEVANDFQSNKLSATLGASTKVGDATLKTKLNNALDLELSWKKKLNSQLTVTTSGKLGLGDISKSVDFSKYVPIPFGVQLELQV